MPEPDIIVSIEALEQLPPALRRFRQFVAEHLQLVRADLRHVRQSLEDAQRDTADEVRQLQAEIADTDPEGDTSGLERELDAAKDRLRAIDRTIRDVDEVVACYHREAERLRRVMDEHVPRSETVLAHKADQLQSLRAIHSEGDVGLVGLGGHVVMQNADAKRQVGGGVIDLTTNPLPSGFCWVRLSEIDLVDALRDVQTLQDFRTYATYDMLRGGLETLRTTVLPAISERGYTADSFFFEQLDRAMGADPAQGARHVYESFFLSDAIALGRSFDGGLLKVANGRHRIKVALDAGWLALPVKIVKIFGGTPR